MDSGEEKNSVRQHRSTNQNLMDESTTNGPASVTTTSADELPDNDSQTTQPLTAEADEGNRGSPEGQENEHQIGSQNEENGRSIPKINCPERIVLCFDLSSELNRVMLRQSQDKSVFEMLKRSMEFFVKHKLEINEKHKIAIVTLDKNALWIQDFSSDVSLISDTLDNIHTNKTDPLEQFDMTLLLETLENHVELPVVENVDIPPKYVVRVILIYGRSHSNLPTFSGEGKQIFGKYIACPYFFFDVLYVHEMPDEDNKCEEIYDAFCTFDEAEDCFVLEVSHIAARLFENTAKLLAHPLQRPKQQDIGYRIDKSNDGSDEELETK